MRSQRLSVLDDIKAEYDLVFAGGGTAACIIASRLATAFPELTILVLESGPTTKDKKEHIQPGQFLAHSAPLSKTMKFYTSTPSEHVDGRSVIVPSARCIGGGSSVNFMIYNRPSASDFHDWENEFGNPGWGAKDMIPMLQKAETYEIEPSKPTHGSSGPLKVSFGGDAMLDIGRQFLETGAKFERDRPICDEGNGLNEDSINVFFRCPKWISSDGRRSDVAHHYIYNKSLGNLSVFDGCLVNRVGIENGVATGVEFLLDKRVYGFAPQDVRTVKARRLVVVSAGTMGSPLILERSGIGKKEILEKAGISLVHELSGVGENYQDHPFYASPYIADPNSATLDSIFRGDPETWTIASAQWEKDGSGLLSTNIESCIKIRPRPEELTELGPDFTDYWNSVLANKPDKPLFWITVSPGLPVDQSALPSVRYMVSACILGYPASRGYLHISSVDPCAAPDFHAGYLSDPADVIALRWAYKKCRELTRRLPAFRGALGPAHPQFPQDSSAALTDVGPLPLEAPKIVYSAEDDEAIDTNVRQSVQTAWHSVCHSLFMPGLYIDVLLQLGTCAMKSLAQGGVVDSKLNVYGIANLKVADMSIAPSNVNSNTYSTAHLTQSPILPFKYRLSTTFTGGKSVGDQKTRQSMRFSRCCFSALAGFPASARTGGSVVELLSVQHGAEPARPSLAGGLTLALSADHGDRDVQRLRAAYSISKTCTAVLTAFQEVTCGETTATMRVRTASVVTLNAIQASTDAFPPLKSAVSAVIVVLELSEKAKSNKKGCEHIAKRSAQLVQDIWRQTKDFNVALPAEVENSFVQIEKLFKEIEEFFEALKKENFLERFARQDRNKSQVEEYGRLLDEAMSHFSINLELATHRLHVESAAADQKRHAAVLAVSRMSESERVQLLTQIRGKGTSIWGSMRPCG
ncbi:GMC oxidoreductase-domain-containing protein [Mycena vulgaris]|nr:GMC oxidoreductase-domain-containing protein [Mycena vulgaris]